MMDNIGAVVCFDGLRVGHEFQVKEMGVCLTFSPRCFTFTFEVCSYDNLTKEEKLFETWARRNVKNQLDTQIDEHWKLSQKWVFEILHELHQMCLSASKPIIGFRGIHLEHDIFRYVDITHFNLEQIKCPNYYCLCKKVKNELQVDTLLQLYNAENRECMFHYIHANVETVRCCMFESILYVNWLINQSDWVPD
jgi:hypothetical protein